MARGHRRRWAASIGMLALLALLALLAACGQTTMPATNGADASLKGLKTPTAIIGTPTATTIPLPYTFPKQWLPAPDSSDLPPEIGSLAFAPTSPQIGYTCGTSASNGDNSAATPPYVVATSDGGQSWHTVAGSAAHAKTACTLFVDQNNERDVFAEAGDFLRGQQQLYRSQDGGATWKPIPQPTVTGMNTVVEALAVVQSRLVALIGLTGEGAPPHNFYVSDNSGQSWSPIDPVVNGQKLDIGQMWFDGPALVVSAGTPCSGGCGYALPVGAGRMGGRPLGQPLSSQPPPTTYYFKTSDGGRTWAPFTTPVSNLGNLTFARASNSSTTYALGMAVGVPNQPAATNVAFYSSDGGVHWRQLPTLAGVENGYLDPGSLGQGGLFVLPDGSVVAMTFHSVGTAEPNQGFYAGAFLLHPGDAPPTWQPLILRTDGNFWQAIPTATGIRVWLVQVPPTAPDDTSPPGGHLVYFDLP